MSILGLDYGEKRIGVAIANGEQHLAIPITVVERASEKEDMDKIVRLIKQYNVERIVVGLPRSLNGSLGQQAEEVLNFTESLSQHINIPLDTWDERFSTTAAESLFKDAGIKKAKRKKLRDAMAAAIILQGYLDSKKPED